MQNIRMEIRYDGTRYSGWQKQGNTENTIQGKLERAISRVAGEKAEVQGSGRTDAGVHALRQTANVRLCHPVNPETFAREVNRILPEDIAVLEASEVPERFHSRLSAIRKTYLYRLYTGSAKPVFERRQVAVLREPVSLDVASMREAARMLCGVHDFTSFCGNPSMKKSAVRRIDCLEITETDDELDFRITGDGFLQNMVRIIVGTLVEVGCGRMNPGKMKTILAGKDRRLAGPMAAAKGLTLVGAEYPGEK